MVNNPGASIQLNIVGIILLAILTITTFSLGIYGFSSVYVAKPNITYPGLTRWFDVLYSTIKLFSLLSSPVEEDIKHWAVSGARLTAACSVFFTIAFATLLAAGNWIKANILVKRYKNHYVIFGLNNESMFLIDDLIAQNKQVVVIEDDHNNPFVSSYSKKRITLILADGSDISTQLKSSILKATAAITMTSCDLKNLEILKTMVESSYTPQLQWYVGLENIMSYKLFEPGAFYSIESIKKQSTGLLLNIFNLNELVAINLIQNIKLGQNANTIDANAPPVKILVQGFDAIGQAVLRELLLLTHFSNGVKAEITIVAIESDDFFINHHQVLKNANGHGLDLWDINFIKEDAHITTPKQYNHIIVCNEDEDIALKNILWLYDLCTLNEMQHTDHSTTFHYYNALNHDIKHQQITSFGALEKVSSYKQLINGQSEKLARTNHEAYAKTELGLSNLEDDELSRILRDHDQETANSSKWLHWVNQPLFKRRSNFTAERHIVIKLLALGNISPTKENLIPLVADGNNFTFLPYLNEFEDINKPMITAWLASIKEKLAISEAALTERIHQLAIAEHSRWNAFHVVNNWRHGKEKNENLKTHDCLLSWEELKLKRPDTIKYDYKNVYLVAESLILDQT